MMNAPGANINTNAPLLSGNMRMEAMLPLPRNSRHAPNIVSATVNPSPAPMPSAIDDVTLWRDANASARPSKMQLTTINGMNIPRLSLSAGV